MEPKSYHHSQLSPTHEAIIEMIRPSSRVLEMGCATGYVTQALKERLGCSVCGVEIAADQAALAEQFAERVVVGDIGSPDTWGSVGGDYDYVIFADVLEHLSDPWEALRRTSGVLRSNGRVIASIPNVASYKVRKDLVLGRFDYTDYGILDNTHLRFFTPKTARALFAETGYDILDFLRMFRGRVDRNLSRMCPDAFTYQFVVQAGVREP